jgi:hypothetical protein
LIEASEMAFTTVDKLGQIIVGLLADNGNSCPLIEGG